jgi:DNA-binding HxlR family transcriptional regulator
MQEHTVDFPGFCTPVVPPHVDCALTPLGRGLLDTVRGLLNWALERIDDIDKARQGYDTPS